MEIRRAPLVVLLAASVLAAPSCGGDDDATSSPGDDVELSAEAQRGMEVAEAQGCTSCHRVSGDDGVGPSWQGLAGSDVELSDGSVVVADEEYLTRSIVEPNAQIVAGYNGIMPERALDDGDVAAIVAYLQELGERP